MDLFIWIYWFFLVLISLRKIRSFRTKALERKSDLDHIRAYMRTPEFEKKRDNLVKSLYNIDRKEVVTMGIYEKAKFGYLQYKFQAWLRGEREDYFTPEEEEEYAYLLNLKLGLEAQTK